MEKVKKSKSGFDMIAGAIGLEISSKRSDYNHFREIARQEGISGRAAVEAGMILKLAHEVLKNPGQPISEARRLIGCSSAMARPALRLAVELGAVKLEPRSTTRRPACFMMPGVNKDGIQNIATLLRRAAAGIDGGAAV